MKECMKIKYPKHRKSPVRHHVKSHSRQGKSVRSYTRGEGSRRIPSYTTKRRISKEEPKSFTINIKYSERKGDGESVLVFAKDYQSALDEALEERVDKREPVEVEIIDPDFGRIFKAIGTAAKKAGKLGAKAVITGAKYTVKGAQLFGKAAAEEIAKRAQSFEERLEAKKLLRESYSTDRFKRLRARAELRKKFPEIYTVSDFSRPGETLYEVSKKTAEQPIIIQHRRTLIQLRRTLKRKGITPPAPVTPRRKGETPEEYEKRMYRAIKWHQAALEKA